MESANTDAFTKKPSSERLRKILQHKINSRIVLFCKFNRIHTRLTKNDIFFMKTNKKNTNILIGFDNRISDRMFFQVVNRQDVEELVLLLLQQHSYQLYE